MRLYNFLKEDSSNKHVTALQKDCKQFLQDWNSVNRMQSVILWRGMKGAETRTANIRKLSVNKNRTPLDTNKASHKFVDDFYKQKFGVGLRSETIFATSLANIAAQYGTRYAVLPAGNYTLYSNAEIEDLFSNIFRTTVELIFTYIVGSWGKFEGWLKQHNIFLDDKLQNVGSYVDFTSDFLSPNIAVDYNSSASKTRLSKPKLVKYNFQEENGKWIILSGADKQSDVDVIVKCLTPVWNTMQAEIKKVLSSTKKISLAEAHKVKTEIMIACDEYYIVDQYFMNGILPDLMKNI